MKTMSKTTDKQKEDITLDKFKALCTELFKQRVKVDELTAAMKPDTDKLAELKEQVMSYLADNEMTNFRVNGFGLLVMKDHFSVPVPKTIEQKKLFGKYLQEKGIFWEMMSVNSATLNSFHDDEIASAVARGDVDFKLPGIGEASHRRTLSMTKE